MTKAPLCYGTGVLLFARGLAAGIAAAVAGATATAVAVVIINQQENDDDEQNPGAVIAAKEITQTHIFPPPYNHSICLCRRSGANNFAHV